MSETFEIFSTPVDALVTGELRWRDYINSLTPEDLEKQRQYDRGRVNKWYQENKERKRDYCKEYAEQNKEKLTKQYACEQCGGRYQHQSRAKHRKTKKHQDSLIGTVGGT